MGWSRTDFPDHEGYIVGLVRDTVRQDWRELGYRERWREAEQIAAQARDAQREKTGAGRSAAIAAGRLYRELVTKYFAERAIAAHPPERTIYHVQVACECGWRSPRMTAPIGTTFAPWTVDLPDSLGMASRDFEGRALKLWQAHMDDVAQVDDVAGVLLGLAKPRGAGEARP